MATGSTRNIKTDTVEQSQESRNNPTHIQSTNI